MKTTLTSLIYSAVLLTTAIFQTQARGDLLGSASSFGVLGSSTVTSAGFTVINGNLGVYPGTAITGFGPGIVNGAMHSYDAVSQAAHNDAASAFLVLAAMEFNSDLTGQNLGGMTLTPGVYFFTATADLDTVPLTLDGQGDPNAVFVFQIGSTLTTAISSSVVTINGANARNVYWQVGSSATLNIGTAFQGTIIAQASITLSANVTLLNGRALALAGAVTMVSNTITASGPPPLGGDINGDGIVNAEDLTILLAQWGGPGTADRNSSGVVDGEDLVIVLGNWFN